MKKIIQGILLSAFTSLHCSPADPHLQDMHAGVALISGEQPRVADTTGLYREKILLLAHNKPSEKWPVQAPAPLPGAILPYRRIVAYYGNLYTSRMGILGERPREAMLEKLRREAMRWEAADTAFPVKMALHYIAVTAQRSPGKNSKYRLRMPFHQIDTVLAMARGIHALVFLDVQLGHSTLQEELPALEKYLLMPDVHLGIDPEYSMKNKDVPCASIGTLDARDINYAVSYLAGLVKQYQLPPKTLVVHRFTQAMITNYKAINTCPEVQIVINMDGFGHAAKKISTYNSFIAREPVQFTGFKVFYRNDTTGTKAAAVMLPEEILKLYPKPVYIQYQ